MNFIPAELAPGLRPGARTLGIRPEHARLAGDGPLSMTVAQVEQLGGSSVVHGHVVQGAPFEVVLNGQTAIQRGDVVRIALPPEHLHGFDANELRL
jgi:multiple sugar transport system ATP-binding protein